MSKKLTKEQARKAEQNKDKRKKLDYRKFANKFFRNPTEHLPLQLGGMGPGKRAYCYDCKDIALITITKFETGITTCQICGGTSIEQREKYPSWWKKLYWRLKGLHYNWRNRK